MRLDYRAKYQIKSSRITTLNAAFVDDVDYPCPITPSPETIKFSKKLISTTTTTLPKYFSGCLIHAVFVVSPTV